MQSSDKGIINIVFYAESEENVKSLAAKVLKEVQGDVYHEEFEGVDVFGYLRWPSQYPTSSPQGITDILLIHLDNPNSEHLETVKSYVDTRKGIPFKFLTSPSDLSEQAKNMEVEFIGDVTGDIKQKVLRPSYEMEKTLRDTFRKIDSNNNGFIDSQEIIQASQELGHSLTPENAKEIAASLSTDGHISYEKFKQWWVMGRTDFNSFRKLVGIGMIVNKYIKQSSDVFNKYLDQLKKEASKELGGLLGKLNIGPTEDFEFGTALNLHLTAGNEFLGILNSLPNSLKEAPASFGIEIRLTNPEIVPVIVDTLKGIKDMIVSSIPDVAALMDAGLGVNFRLVGNSVFIDVTYGGALGDQIGGVLSLFNLSALDFNGGHDLHFTTKFSPVDLLNLSLDDCVKNASYIKLEGKGEYVNLRTILNFLVSTAQLVFEEEIPERLLPVFYLFKALSVIRKVDFNFQYDTIAAHEAFKDYVNASNYNPNQYTEKCQQWSETRHEQINEMVNNIAQQAGVMLEPFKPILLAIDFDNISVFAMCPALKVYLKVNLMLRGVSQLVACKLA